MQVEQEIKSLIKVCLTILASLCYTYSIPSKIPKGRIRFFSLLPIFYLFAVLPLSLSAALPAGVVGLFTTWIANFKLLLFAFGLGPLSSGPPQNSLLLFIFTTCLPIKTNQYDQQTSVFHKPPKVPLNLPTKVLLFAIFIALTDYSYAKNVHPKILLAQYCCALYLFLDVVVGLSNVMMRTVLGFELESPSNEPYLSTSLQDFWGRRWNLMVTNALRHTVYKPVRSAIESLFGKKWAPLPAVLAAFLVSGLMHELIFFYMTRAAPTWEVTWYFVLHGVCLVVELGVKKALRGRWRLHGAVSAPLTIGFVAVTATWLFFPPITRNGVDVRANQESKEMIHFVKDKLKCVWFHKSKGLIV